VCGVVCAVVCGVCSGGAGHACDCLQALGMFVFIIIMFPLSFIVMIVLVLFLVRKLEREQTALCGAFGGHAWCSE